MRSEILKKVVVKRLNIVSLTDWIQRMAELLYGRMVVNRFKLCIFDRLNTTDVISEIVEKKLWIALNFVSLTDWIQQLLEEAVTIIVVNRFKFCIFDRLNTT